ncbi:XRE family transcriptional regulator [Asanoa sp. NPDC049518]|uniref:XRE family transcriptional regulator n=1 Tax=unclassified Asanoa TaxID=2685164 RepID=UPI003432607B
MATPLARLLLHRGVDVTQPELQRVVDGAEPGPSLLRRLAPVLGLHAADLFVVAGLEVPEDLAPLAARDESRVERVVRHAVLLGPDQRHRLRQLVRSLPQVDRWQPVEDVRSYEQYEPGPGALVLRMLHSRNLSWVSSAKLLFGLTRTGPLAASTIGAIGHGRKKLTPELVAAFATVLGIPPDDLAALTGTELPGEPRPPHRAAADLAELIWELRRLTAEQTDRVLEEAMSMPSEAGGAR